MIRTSTTGIFQSDILIRAAIIAGLQEIRDEPWRLDYVFSWMLNDTLTRSIYGEKEIAEAKSWFLKTEIAVTMAYRTDQPQLPCIGIELVSSEEGPATLSDTHYETSEDVPASEVTIRPGAIVGPFTPFAYDIATGIVTLPSNLSTASIFPGMYLFDTTSGKGYQIIAIEQQTPTTTVLSEPQTFPLGLPDVLSAPVTEELTGGLAPNTNTFTIAPGIKADFTQCYIAARSAFWIVPLHSLLFRETYRLRCFVSGNAVHLSFLYSILMFIVLSKKQDLLEGRGFENYTVSGSGFQGSMDPGNPEIIFMRDITLSGLVRQYWPGTPTQKLDGVLIDYIKIIDGGTSNLIIADQVAGQGWELEFDQFGDPDK